METLKTLQSNLYEKWIKERNYEYFVYDGILNYQKWESTKPKILFLLKESADDFTNIADKDIDVTSGNGTHFWWNICYWKYLLFQANYNRKVEFIPTTDLPEVKYNNNLLDSIAYVNVKKSCDNKTKSRDSEIFTYAIKDKHLLKEQIDLINPDVVFCSKVTFKAYNHIYENSLVEINNICYKHIDRLILNFRHPSYFQIAGGRETLFNDLKRSLTQNGNVFLQFNWSENKNGG